jgi:hypothetical protein
MRGSFKRNPPSPTLDELVEACPGALSNEMRSWVEGYLLLDYLEASSSRSLYLDGARMHRDYLSAILGLNGAQPDPRLWGHQVGLALPGHKDLKEYMRATFGDTGSAILLHREEAEKLADALGGTIVAMYVWEALNRYGT